LGFPAYNEVNTRAGVQNIKSSIPFIVGQNDSTVRLNPYIATVNPGDKQIEVDVETKVNA